MMLSLVFFHKTFIELIKGVLSVKIDVMDSHDMNHPLTIADFNEEKPVEAHSFGDTSTQYVLLTKELKYRGRDFSKSISFDIRYSPLYTSYRFFLNR